MTILAMISRIGLTIVAVAIAVITALLWRQNLMDMGDNMPRGLKAYYFLAIMLFCIATVEMWI